MSTSREAIVTSPVLTSSRTSFIAAALSAAGWSGSNASIAAKPAGSESVVDNVKSAIATAQNAYNNLATINKQIYDTVEKTVEQNVATVKAASAKTKKRAK